MGYECSKKSPTGPTEWTPKPEDLIALDSSNLLRGPLVRSHLIFDGNVLGMMGMVLHMIRI